MATFMMKSRRNSQGLLLLLCLLLLTFSFIPAEPTIRGNERITADGGRKSKSVKDAVILDDDIFNGCTPHNASAWGNFCCDKDNLCWPSLSECVINCPCKVRCNR